MHNLKPVSSTGDILAEYRKTPIEMLLEFHNLKKPIEDFEKPEIIIGTCMDHRVYLKIPERFAYVIRTPGANMKHAQFGVSFALAMAELKYMTIIGHTDCGMRDLNTNKDSIIDGLTIYGGWNKNNASEHFHQSQPIYEIGDEIEFVLKESDRIREMYPGVLVAPLLYKVEDGFLYQILTKD